MAEVKSVNGIIGVKHTPKQHLPTTKTPILFGVARLPYNDGRSVVGREPQLKPGHKPRHRSVFMIYFKNRPNFSKTSLQWISTKLIGLYCGPQMKGKGVRERREAAAECAKQFAGMKPEEIIKKIVSEKPELKNAVPEPFRKALGL